MFFSYSFFLRSLFIASVGVLSACDNLEENAGLIAPIEINWTVCDFPVPANSEPLAGKIECGFITVPENRANPDGKTIDFHFAVSRRLGENPENNAFFDLQGGPGLAGNQVVYRFTQQLEEIRGTHDLVFVDYRGTGKSNPLACVPKGDLSTVQPYLVHFIDTELYAQCRSQVPFGVDLSQYNTNNIVDDINALRQALGYQKIDVHGSSYGTRVAQVFVRRHGENVRTTILDGPEDLTSPLGSKIARISENSLRSLIADCKADAMCSQTYPNFEQDLEVFLDQLREGPLVAEVKNPETGEMETASFSYSVAAGTLRNLLYNTETAARLPYQVDRLSRGEFGPFLNGIVGFYRLIYGTSEFPPYVYVGLYASVTCAEDNPFVDLEAVLPEAEGTVMGAEAFREGRRACEIWDVAPADASFLEPVVSDVPTLILVGALDPITPPQNAYNIIKTLSDAVVLEIENHGHNFRVPCTRGVKMTFIKAGITDAVDRTCGTGIERPKFFIPAEADE